MDKNFGIKDFFLFTLIGLVVVLIVLAMVQVDRQWKSIQQLNDRVEALNTSLLDVNKTLRRGISSSTNTLGSPATAPAVASDAAPQVDQNGKPWVDPFHFQKDAEKKPGFARGDWLVDNFGAKLKAVTPYTGGDVAAANVQAKVCEGLLYRDPQSLEFVPLLARAWKVSDDGKSITFYLRPDVTFSDGEPFTADDVVFTYEWVRNGAVNAPRERSALDKLDQVKKIDDLTVEFTFKEYFFKSLETVGGSLVLPKHFYSKYSPEQFNQNPGLLMGTGPYRLQSPDAWTPGQQMVLVRNDRYWGDPPAPNRLVYLEVEEETASKTMFTNGELDIFSATSEQYVNMKKDPKVLAISTPMDYVSLLAGYTYIAWNEQSNKVPTVYADKRVRQAMTMLIDRETIARDVFLGYASVANGPFAPGSKQADPTVKPWPYDTGRALKLLEEAGFKDTDDDGVLNKPDGSPFKIKLTFPSKSAVYDRVTLMMKDSLAKAHIVLERDPVEWPLLQKKLENRDFEAIMLGWSGSVDDDPYQMFDSAQMADQGDNVMSYNSPECDKAIESARTCVDEPKRTELWRQAHRILAGDCPYTFLLNRKATVFNNKRWQNIGLTTMGTNYNRLDYQPLPWFVPRAQQKYTK